MVCPNCKSTDIVNIQGQDYCINCGQLVPKSATQEKKPTVAADTRHTPVEVKPQAPAKAASAEIKPEPKPAVKKDESETKTPEVKAPAVKKTVAASTGASSLIINHSRKTPAANLPEPPQVKARSMSDITPSSGGVAVATKPAVKTVKADPEPEKPKQKPVPAPAEQVHEKEPQHKPERPHKPAMKIKNPVSASAPADATEWQAPGTLSAALKGLSSWTHASRWEYGLIASAMLSPVILLTVVYVLTRSFLFGLGLDLGWPNFPYLTIPAIYLLLAYLIASFSGSAIIYGSMRHDDNRPAASEKWAEVGLDSLWPKIGLDVAVLIIALLLGGGTYAGWINAANLKTGNLELTRGLIILPFALLAVLTAGAKVFAWTFLVMGEASPWTALKTGYKLAARRFFRLLGALITAAVITSAVAAAGYEVSLLVGKSPIAVWWQWSLYLLIILVVSSLVVTFNLSFWPAITRRLVVLGKDKKTLAMLSGRSPHGTNHTAITTIVAVGMALCVLLGYIALTGPLPF